MTARDKGSASKSYHALLISPLLPTPATPWLWLLSPKRRHGRRDRRNGHLSRKGGRQSALPSAARQQVQERAVCLVVRDYQFFVQACQVHLWPALRRQASHRPFPAL